ncbi:MAG: hypothetical protein Q4D65_10820 [Peptostreptococcaceae bacterium]|nr:hypothetical protein [Peptostreptococcaceae bacterium]
MLDAEVRKAMLFYKKADNINQIVKNEDVLRIGKKKFVRIKVQ